MPNMPDYQRRILEFLDTIDLSDREISTKIGASHGYIGAARRGSIMGLDKVEGIISICSLSRKWVFEGKGDPLDKASEEAEVSMYGDNPAYRRSEFFSLMSQLVEEEDLEQRRTISNKAIQMISSLEDQKSDLQEEVVKLMKRIEGLLR